MSGEYQGIFSDFLLPQGSPGSSDGKESACNVGDLGLTLGWKDPLEERMATHSSILAWRNPMDRGAWWPTVHRVTKNRTRLKHLSAHTTHATPFAEIW